ncbi:MAG: hypothetical protein Q8S41_12545 [Lutibacter sp.]|nr:hypothetical protein [Lutibacter sp.]
MKKSINKYSILSMALFMFFSSINAQESNEEQPTSIINMVARYLPEDNAVEMRFFPDKKSILYSGIKFGFVVERAEISEEIKVEADLKYIKIAEVFPYNEGQWTAAFSKGDDETKHNLNLAKDFFDNIDKQTGGKFNFDEGIKEMKEQKSKEDFEYLIFVMNAIKDKDVAEAIGLSYTDKTVQKNKNYLYRIKLNKEPKSAYKVVGLPFNIETAVNKKQEERKIYTVTGDKELTFLWEESDMVSGALVERKNNKTGNYEPLNETPVYTLGETSNRNGYKDENLTNYQWYEYRFYGYNPFGEKILFGSAKAMPKDLTPPKKPLLIKAKHEKFDEVLVEWNVTDPIDNDLKGFIVARGEINDGNFQILHQNLLSKSTRSFTDKTFSGVKSNYYVVQAIDTSGNISSTTPAFVTITDSIPPAKPKFISGKIDSLGIVTINIEMNKELDLMGYRLYRSNSDEHEFSLIREGFSENDSIIKPVQVIFKDTVTLNSLTPYIYYKIIALDFNFNQSESSEIIKVKRPDKIPPTTPVFKNVIVKQNEIELHFALSESEDVVEQYLYRKLKTDAPWELLSKLDNKLTSFTDKKLKQGTVYFYSLRAKDDSNLFSEYAKPVYGKPFDNGVRPPIKILVIKKDDKDISLSWEYEFLNDNTYFVIYKADKKGNLIQYKNTTKLLFKEPVGKETNSYAVKVFTKDGGQSKISNTVIIR